MTKIYDYKLQKNPCCVTATKTYDQNTPERLTHFLRIIAGLMQTVALPKTYDQIALQRCPLSRTIRKPHAKCHTKTKLRRAYIIIIQSNETRKG